MYDIQSYRNYRSNMRSAYARAHRARAQELSRLGRLVKKYLTNLTLSKARSS